MNLQPITPPEPRCRVVCSRCSQIVSSSRAVADLDAKPGTYLCRNCNPLKIYRRAVAAGLPVTSYRSDLYLKDSRAARKLVDEYHAAGGARSERFHNRVEGGLWWDIPFAFEPWWKARATS